MIITTEEKKLIEELQELYFKSKQNLYDLEVLENELNFLKELFSTNCALLISNDEFEKISDILIAIALIETKHTGIKTNILSYLHKLEPLITNSSQDFDFRLIEVYAKIESELSGMRLNLKSIKALVFELIG